MDLEELKMALKEYEDKNLVKRDLKMFKTNKIRYKIFDLFWQKREMPLDEISNALNLDEEALKDGIFKMYICGFLDFNKRFNEDEGKVYVFRTKKSEELFKILEGK